MLAQALIGGYTVQLSLNPTNTYSIVKVINNQVSKILISGIPSDKIESTMQLILEHEKPALNTRFMIEQD